ncbi:MAG: FHA domain-containing protein [Oscillospiraceae bacterium]|nr:FHA domain-containing protein [Oscillospiraceae bacterium]
MDFTELFEKYPYLREATTAFVVIFADICALMILIAAARERRRGDRLWAREGRGYMLASGATFYPLGAAEILIGRHPAADIRFDDNEISRFHALLTLSNGQWTIEDIGAQNGIFVNGRRVTQPRILHQNDLIQIGRRRLTVVRGTGKGVA